ncbi:acyl-CoA dehydrogenase family protein [Planococcus sp. ISL-109]|uniref:acyl-CoA dehydrogenase family protein n=1 Tax=Planococcus sp. ISL-109 TaxID=2819166 RepID=UPI002035BC2C|nr:acyl-CoA dehydrogenase family protein [Planococcus sp. ISL-109]
MPRTRAAFNGNELVVNGEKTYVSAAPALDYFFVTATDDEDQVIIPAKADGVTIEETWDMLAMKGTASQTLRLTNVRIPITSTPAIQQIIGVMELELTTARQLLYGTAERYEQAEDKFAMQEALDVMKIVGSRALSESNPMHRYYLNVRAGLYNPPMGDMVKARLASRAIANFSLKETEE